MDDRHPLAQVLTGGHALWATADVVLAVGTRLQWPTAVWGTDDKLKIIKVDADPDEIERIAKPEIGLVGDAAAVLARLNDHLRHLPPERPDRVAASLAVKQATARSWPPRSRRNSRSAARSATCCPTMACWSRS